MTVDAVPNELLQHLLERQHARLAVDQRQQDDRERVLQRRELVELVEHHVGIGVALELDDQPHRLLEIAFVANGGDAGDFALVDRAAAICSSRGRATAGTESRE